MKSDAIMAQPEMLAWTCILAACSADASGSGNANMAPHTAAAMSRAIAKPIATTVDLTIDCDFIGGRVSNGRCSCAA